MAMEADRTRTRWVAMLLFSGLVLYLCWRMLQPFLLVLVWAGGLAIVFAPIQRRLVRWTRRPSLAASLSLLAITVLFVGPLALVGTALTSELRELAEQGPAAVTELLEDPERGARLRELVDSAQAHLDLETYFTKDALKEWVEGLSHTLIKRTATVIGGALGLLINLVLIVFATFFLLRDGPAFVTWCSRLLPLEPQHTAALVARTREVVNASVYGVLVIALVQGLLGWVMFVILGIPSATLWGVLMTLFALIPVVGPSIIWLPVAVLLALTGHWGQALVLATWGAVVVGLSDNLLRPMLVGRRVRMHELLVFFSVLGGLQAFGMVGIFVGPVILAVAISMLEVLLGEETPIGAPTNGTAADPATTP